MEIINYKLVGKRLKQSREIKNISLEEAGRYVGVNKSTIMRWENGQTEKFKIPVLKKLAEFYDVNPSWLMGFNVSQEYPTISNLKSSVYMCPVYGRISAGQPNWAEERIEGKLPIDINLMNIINPEECFFLRVNGESMNKEIKNGAYALIRKTDFVKNGEIAVVLVNGYDATLKKFSKQNDLIILEPMSTDPSFTTQVYGKDTEIKVIGKYIGKFELNK